MHLPLLTPLFLFFLSIFLTTTHASPTSLQKRQQAIWTIVQFDGPNCTGANATYFGSSPMQCANTTGDTHVGSAMPRTNTPGRWQSNGLIFTLWDQLDCKGNAHRVSGPGECVAPDTWKFLSLSVRVGS